MQIHNGLRTRTLIPASVHEGDPLLDRVQGGERGLSTEATKGQREHVQPPSCIASSMAMMLASKPSLRPSSVSYSGLYTAMRACGSPPRATPAMRLWKPAVSTAEPGPVDAVWVPWPLASRAERYSLLRVDCSVVESPIRKTDIQHLTHINRTQSAQKIYQQDSISHL